MLPFSKEMTKFFLLRRLSLTIYPPKCTIRNGHDDDRCTTRLLHRGTVMARKRKKKTGVTHVLLHDINRRVEKEYTDEFLCKEYLKHSVGRLWHFDIPPASNVTGENEGGEFCYVDI